MSAQSAHRYSFNPEVNKGNKFTESRNKRVTFMSESSCLEDRTG